MFNRLTSAIFRAALMVAMVVTPTYVVPGSDPDGASVVVLIAVFAAALTLFEYGSAYPGIIEFRDAPPFNRIRFVSLFLTVALLSLVARHQIAPDTVTQFFTAIGTLIGRAIDFPLSPVRLMVLMLPDDAPVSEIILLRTAAGIAYLISLLSLAFFFIVLRVQRWPSSRGSFNVWINLPTFDPTIGGDVVDRLTRDARFNIAMGFTLPFVVPIAVRLATGLFDAASILHDQTMIWTVTAWAFLPASLFMRGIAMRRIAAMISDERARNVAEAEARGLLTA